MTGIIASGIKWTAEKLSSLLTSAAYAAQETYETQNASVLEDLRKLERTMRRIQSILMDAGERDVEEHAEKLWLKKLKEVAYDAEDVVGDYEYDVLHAKIQVRNRMLLGIDGTSGQKRKRQGEVTFKKKKKKLEKYLQSTEGKIGRFRVDSAESDRNRPEASRIFPS